MKIGNLLLLIIATSSINCFYNCESFKDTDHKIYGIDVSHYQDNTSKIDWHQVADNKNPKISFAYIRTTMGKDGKDNAFLYNFKKAKENNIKVGVYHYYRPNENAIEQFENFLNNNANIGDMPPVLDIEEMSDLGPKKLRKELMIFLNLVQKHYNKEPIIYAHQRFYNTYLRGHFPDYEIWIARQNGIYKKPENNQIKKEPFLLDGKCPLIWQYSGTGNIDGISGNVDLNITQQQIWQ